MSRWEQRYGTVEERDAAVLSTLKYESKRDPERWHRLLDLGGADGSHHSATLARLVRKGLVERMQRGAYPGRGSWLYRLRREE